MTAPALEFRGVTVRYEPDAAPVLDAVSFAIAPGERVALVGLNGSGKTTLLLAVGLVPHAGELHVAGQRLERRTLASVRERIGFVFNVPEDQLLFPTVLEDVSFGLLRRGASSIAAAAQARQALVALGIEHLADSPSHHLSHGQQQRVALAGALVTDPVLLLLDEPTAGLDPPGKRTLADLLKRRDAALLITTHDLDFAAHLCTRFLLLEQGRLVLEGEDPRVVERRWER